MFSRVIPSWEQIKQFKQPLTDGEWHLLQFLDTRLRKDEVFQGDDLTNYNGWLIFIQPYLNGSRPDVVIFNPLVGVQIFEVKDWNLDNYSFEIKKDDEKSYKAFCVSDSRGTYQKKSPIKQIEYYKEKIASQLIPQIGEEFDKNRQQFGLVKTTLYFHKSTTAEAQRLFQASSSRIIGYDALSGNNLRNVVPDSYLSQSHYWREDWNKELLFWFNPPFHAIEPNPLALIGDQKKLAEPQPGRHRVRGVAGSGKTQVLAYRAAKLASQGYRVLVLTFNLTLWHLVHDMVNKSPFAFYWRNLDITYFHGFCKDIFNEFNEVWPRKSCDAESLFREVVPNKVIEIISANEYRQYDAILIDEGQDFCVEWYRMLCHFLTSRDEFVVVCDKKQNIYARELRWLDKRVGERTEEGKSQVDKFGKWIDLKKIIRLPARIAELSIKFSTEFDLYRDKDMDINVEKPDLFNQFEDHVVWWNVENYDWLCKVKKAFELIKNQATHKHPSDTVILLPDRYVGLRCVHYFESKKKVLVNHVFEDADDKIHHKYKKAFWMGDSRLKMSTIHSFKGWEVQNVIVVIPSFIRGDERVNDNVIYTAITRPKENLIVINANARYWKFGENFPDEWRE